LLMLALLDLFEEGELGINVDFGDGIGAHE